MKGYRLFACTNDQCDIVLWKEWANQHDSPSGACCPACMDEGDQLPPKLPFTEHS